MLLETLRNQKAAINTTVPELIGRRVDLVPEYELNPYIQQRVLAESVDL